MKLFFDNASYFLAILKDATCWLKPKRALSQKIRVSCSFIWDGQFLSGSDIQCQCPRITLNPISSYYAVCAIILIASIWVTTTCPSYRETPNLKRTLTCLVSNAIVDHSDVVEHRLSALLQLHLNSRLSMTSMDSEKTTARENEKHLSFWIGATYIRDLTVCAGFSFCCDMLWYDIGYVCKYWPPHIPYIYIYIYIYAYVTQLMSICASLNQLSKHKIWV